MGDLGFRTGRMTYGLRPSTYAAIELTYVFCIHMIYDICVFMDNTMHVNLLYIIIYINTIYIIYMHIYSNLEHQQVFTIYL